MINFRMFQGGYGSGTILRAAKKPQSERYHQAGADKLIPIISRRWMDLVKLFMLVLHPGRSGYTASVSPDTMIASFQPQPDTHPGSQNH